MPSEHMLTDGGQACPYLLLSSTSREKISIAQVIHLDILNVVAVGHIHVSVDSTAFLGRSKSWRGYGIRRGGPDWGDVDVLNAFPCLELGIDSGRSGRY
jgi:hypothetical protein